MNEYISEAAEHLSSYPLVGCLGIEKMTAELSSSKYEAVQTSILRSKEVVLNSSVRIPVRNFNLLSPEYSLQSPDTGPEAGPDTGPENIAHELPQKYRNVYDEDPEKTLVNLCRLVLRNQYLKTKSKSLLNYSDSMMEVLSSSIDGMKFESIYGGDPGPGGWKAKGRKILSTMISDFDPNKFSKNKVERCFIKGATYITIRDSDLVIPDQKNQKITRDEISYFAFRLTSKVIDNFNKRNTPYADLRRNYFLINGFAEDYYKSTGRKLNKSKIAAMNRILDKSEIISVIKVSPGSQKYHSNRYFLGPNNPYLSKLEDGSGVQEESV